LVLLGIGIGRFYRRQALQFLFLAGNSLLIENFIQKDFTRPCWERKWGGPMKLIVGLGNPGPRYETTRHNVGFMTADLIADSLDAVFKQSRHGALLAEAFYRGQKILVAKPMTYMNLSGQAVASLFNWYKLDVKDLIIVYDDMDLEVGRLRIRGRGSAGGQKGMASIIRVLGTEELVRIRIGVGRPLEGWGAAEHVLSPFRDEEWALMQEVLPRAAAAALELTYEDLETVMNKYN
jgi:PTH1 family peptidyl-tRNA hydrolase